MNDDRAFDGLLEQGFAQLGEGQFDEAIGTFSACLALNSADDRPSRGRGLAHLQLNQSQQAELDFQAAIKLNPKEPENFTGLAVSLAMQNKIYEAIKIYEELITFSPSYVPGFIQLGNLQLRIGAISKGREILESALNLHPTLIQRRTIEAVLNEQGKLDRNRYYRPDFEKLNRDNPMPSFLKNLLSLWTSICHPVKK